MSKELNKAPAEQAGGDERAAFFKHLIGRHPAHETEIVRVVEHNHAAWKAWQARAALAQPSPASDLDPFNLAPHAEAFNEAPAEALKSDQAEVERPVVIARLYRSNDLTMTPFAEVQKPLPMPRSDGTLTVEPLMTVAQHERIVGALRAEIAEWQEAAGRGRSDVVAYIAERAKLLEGRDAALARVAELERELSNEENAHTTTIEQRDNAEHWADQLANAIAERFGVDIGEHSNLNCPWNEALVWMQQLPAQAQHSVPEEFSFEYRHPNGECHTVTVSREQVINEMPDFLFEALCSKFCNCEPVGETNVVECCCDEYAEEFKLIAAAPGKEVGHE
ncbi:hypothetical protein [Pseudomonas aeruginosa]|uniref:hypothetical protein n=1 Tax=Pseudomonas aeruginosa TaxID=287 RepID=UPI0021BE778A|nr:hypothetical protein [Pseudomonas aeruginosa]UXH58356.1 hypothetical protein N5877_28035 [Pseudomonas aeruginosa]